MTDRKLTDRQRRVLRAMSHTWEPAADIAHRAEVDNRGVGSVLDSLTRRGLVQSSWYADHPGSGYGWRLK